MVSISLKPFLGFQTTLFIANILNFKYGISSNSVIPAPACARTGYGGNPSSNLRNLDLKNSFQISKMDFRRSLSSRRRGREGRYPISCVSKIKSFDYIRPTGWGGGFSDDLPAYLNTVFVQRLTHCFCLMSMSLRLGESVCFGAWANSKTLGSGVFFTAG